MNLAHIELGDEMAGPLFFQHTLFSSNIPNFVLQIPNLVLNIPNLRGVRFKILPRYRFSQCFSHAFYQHECCTTALYLEQDAPTLTADLELPSEPSF